MALSKQSELPAFFSPRQVNLKIKIGPIRAYYKLELARPPEHQLPWFGGTGKLIG
jgi:hypothetical protein